MNICFYAVPFVHDEVQRALEAGVQCVLVERAFAERVRPLARVEVIELEEMQLFEIFSQTDEQQLIQRICEGGAALVRCPWEIIPIENILARVQALQTAGLSAPFFGVECQNPDQARLASKILECGVSNLVVFPEALSSLAEIVRVCSCPQKSVALHAARISKIQRVGLGHRVCVDTLSVLQQGQGMLVGNASDFAFLVHAETEYNEYVRARPFRINAGAVHAYAWMPDDRTCYLDELRAGNEVLICDVKGQTRTAIVGRIKKEQRPMLLIEACVESADGHRQCGAVFLQNAETIHLVRENGAPVSVVTLAAGDTVLVHCDQAGRHFGMRIQECIAEL